MCHFSSIAFHHLTLVYFENLSQISSIAFIVVVWCSPHAHPTPRCPRWCDKVSRSPHRSQSEQGQICILSVRRLRLNRIFMEQCSKLSWKWSWNHQVSYWVSINCQPHDRNSFSMWATLHTDLCQHHFSYEGQYIDWRKSWNLIKKTSSLSVPSRHHITLTVFSEETKMLNAKFNYDLSVWNSCRVLSYCFPSLLLCPRLICSNIKVFVGMKKATQASFQNYW